MMPKVKSRVTGNDVAQCTGLPMRTVKSTVAFQKPFVLRQDVGELPPGTYEIEVDEEEIELAAMTIYRRVAIYLHVQMGASTRTIVASPSDFDSALERDRHAKVDR